jgi:repressor LexA
MLTIKELVILKNKDISKYIGKQIKKFRLLRGLTQKELGDKIGVKHNTISSYEAGVNEPEHNTLFVIAETLDINVDDLFPAIKKRIVSTTEKMIALPIVGRISCGNGALAYEDIEGYEPTPEAWLNGSGKFFYLRAKGDSMKNARIEEGDLLLIRQQPDVEDGDIAAVLIDDEAVLKRVYKRKGTLILQSENPAYPPIVCDGKNRVRIIGKLKRTVIKY